MSSKGMSLKGRINHYAKKNGMITTEDVSSIISEDLNMETLSFSYSLTFHPDLLAIC